MSGAAGDRSRTSQTRILDRLRLAARKGDRTALALALDEMRTLAFSPRYWLKYLTLLRHPLARLVDLLIIKQGDKIARQKGWTGPARKRRRPAASRGRKPDAARATRVETRRRRASLDQPSLFPDL
ncbi:MAG: hypothetical protein HY002_06925 [Candidatus Rokubacteria bacterium]|nr:hypothetical protein [Candidatus Rokubacteria bacterium]